MHWPCRGKARTASPLPWKKNTPQWAFLAISKKISLYQQPFLFFQFENKLFLN
jgi:hypothetical protein